MNTLTARRGFSKVCVIGGIIAMFGAWWVFDLSDEIGGRGVQAREHSIIGTSQRSEFMSYVERRQMRSTALVERVSVGDVLPQEGVTYYDIPLRFGAGLDRCALIAGKSVIVDPRARRVVEVIEWATKQGRSLVETEADIEPGEPRMDCFALRSDRQ